MATQSVWGIDIGQCALKALKLHSVDGQVRLEAFDVVEHSKIIGQPDVNADDVIRESLQLFLSRNSVEECLVAVGAPGKSGITRFVKLPPVEPKQIPEIVRFEAEQQIPFDINEVIWCWQSFKDPDAPDVEVGIFAMKRPDVTAVLERFVEVGLGVDVVQMAPLALYNFMDYDAELAPDGATLLIDIGADKTDLVVADGHRIWTRTMQRGGNAFTEALSKAFKLSFSKAEKLKRTAATSKYARQIFQAMRPVFSDLVQEIQRSIGYYTSLHRESRFKKVIGLGNGFKLPGLQKYLEQNLGFSVVRIDSYTKLTPDDGVNLAAFNENVLSFAVAYGLALQGLGAAKVYSNLLPTEITRRRIWSAKRPWFVASAACLLVGFSGWAYRAFADRSALETANNPTLAQVESTIRKVEDVQKQYQALQGRPESIEGDAKKYGEMLKNNDFWEHLDGAVSEALTAVAEDQSLQTPAGLAKLKEKERSKRDLVNVVNLWKVDVPNVNSLTIKDINLDASFTPLMSTAGSIGGGGGGGGGGMAMEASPIENSRYARGMMMDSARGGAFGGGAMGGAGRGPSENYGEAAREAPTGPVQAGFLLYMRGSVPKKDQDAARFLNQLKTSLIEVAAKQKPYMDLIEIKTGNIKLLDSGKPTSSVPVLDPLTGEDTSGDTTFTIGWIVGIKSGPAAPAGGERPSRRGGGQ